MSECWLFINLSENACHYSFYLLLIENYTSCICAFSMDCIQTFLKGYFYNKTMAKIYMDFASILTLYKKQIVFQGCLENSYTLPVLLLINMIKCKFIIMIHQNSYPDSHIIHLSVMPTKNQLSFDHSSLYAPFVLGRYRSRKVTEWLP